MKNQLAATQTITAALLTLVFGMKGGAAHAVTTTILQPDSVTATQDTGGTVNNLINQSGLSASYTSGLSDFSMTTNNVSIKYYVLPGLYPYQVP